MKKNILWIVSILLILSLAFTGCGDNNESASVTDHVENIGDNAETNSLEDITESETSNALDEYIPGFGYQHGYMVGSAYISPFLGLKLTLPDGWAFAAVGFGTRDYADHLKSTMEEDGLVIDLYCGLGDGSSFTSTIPDESIKIQVYDDLESFYYHRDYLTERTGASAEKVNIDGTECDVMRFIDANAKHCWQILLERDHYGAVIMVRALSEDRVESIIKTALEWLDSNISN